VTCSWRKRAWLLITAPVRAGTPNSGTWICAIVREMLWCYGVLDSAR
jgi:hypothetical protein